MVRLGSARLTRTCSRGSALLVLLVCLACSDRAGGSAAVEHDTALQRLETEILPAVAEASGLEVHFRPHLARRSRAELESFLTAQLREELPPERARALVRAYARLGLVPDTLDLEDLLHSLLLEQVVGYYDPAADTLFVVEGAPPAQLGVVLAHELVHALQDQAMDIDSVVRSVRDDNDRSTAVHAALEGHATFAMLEWQLAETMGTRADLTQLPDLSRLVGADALVAGAGMPVLSGAPPLIRQSLLFPYVGGVAFVQGLWRDAGERRPPIGEDLPESTEQILHPEKAAGPHRDSPVLLRFTDAPPPGWSEVHADGLGEFETRMFLAAWLGGADREVRAETGAAGWGGDRYRLLEGPGGAEALIWATAWDDLGDAREFEAAVREAYAARYGDASAGTPRGGPEPVGPDSGPVYRGRDRIVEVELNPRARPPTVRVLDLPAGLEPGALEAASRFTMRAEGS